MGIKKRVEIPLPHAASEHPTKIVKRQEAQFPFESGTSRRGLSRCRTTDTNDLFDDHVYAVAAAARQARCVPAEMGWRWTLKIL
jgi:hypothetical protein